MASYLVPRQPTTVEQKIKGSLFICTVSHCAESDAALHFIEQTRAAHPNAHHNCWAFIGGPPGDQSSRRYSDDGEPAGCAGKPMLSILAHSSIGEICAVVSRYFGGTKLGKGGLIRAYSSSVQQALSQLNTTDKITYRRTRIAIDYGDYARVDTLLKRYQAVIVDRTFSTTTRLTIDIPEDVQQECLTMLRRSTQTFKHWD